MSVECGVSQAWMNDKYICNIRHAFPLLTYWLDNIPKFTHLQHNLGKFSLVQTGVFESAGSLLVSYKINLVVEFLNNGIENKIEQKISECIA